MPIIVHISPIFRTKGGISTVVKNYLGSDGLNKYDQRYIETHGEGNMAQKALMALSAMVQSLKMALFNRPDIIHVHVGDFPSIYRKILVSLPFLFCKKTKKVLHFHGAAFIDQYKTQKDPLKKLIKLFFTQFDIIICLSETWQKLLAEELRLEKTVVIHNAVKVPDKTAPLKAQPRTLRILFLGLIGDRKGLFDLLEAIKILKATDYDIRLLVGGNGDVDKLKTYMQAPSLKKTITYLGWVNEQQREDAFLSSDVFALPSYAEGMPMSVLEAMSYGLPVISTWVGGIPELVQHDKNGILLTPGDINALATTLENLANNPNTKTDMGKTSRDIFIESFSLDNHVKQIDDVYQKVLQSA